MNLPWRYILVSLMIGLFLGAAGGLFASHSLSHRWMKHGPERLLKHLDKKLDLTSAQHTQIFTILNANREKMGTFKQDLRQTTHTEIRKLLTPEQQTKFDALAAKWEAKHRKRQEP